MAVNEVVIAVTSVAVLSLSLSLSGGPFDCTSSSCWCCFDCCDFDMSAMGGSDVV